MKKFLNIITITACTFGLAAGSFAAEKKSASTEGAKKAGEKSAEAAKTSPEKVVGEGKPLPMNSRADSIDASAKTFSMKRKDGVEVKHVVTATTEIMNGTATAKFEDIKVGDYVSVLRKKVSETEYTVVKITKFGPRAAKEGAAKPAEGAKPAEKKAN